MADVGDEKEYKEKKSIHQLNQEDEKVELYRLLDDYKFRRFLWRILEWCQMYSAAPNNNMERFEGGRDIGLRLLEEIFTANADAYTMMRAEAESRKHGLVGSRDPIKKGKKDG